MEDLRYITRKGNRDMRQHNYTKQDDEYLKIWYPHIGPKRCSEHLGRSAQSVQYRANRIGLFYRNQSTSSNKPWTEQEDSILIRFYEELGYAGCAEYFPDRSKTAVIQRAHVLKLRHLSKWTDEEKEIMYKYYPTGGSTACKERLPNKSLSAIKAWAADNELSCETRNHKYSMLEKCIIKEFYATDPNRCYMLLNRNKKSIMHMAEKMGIKSKYFYTPEEDQILIDNYKTLGAAGCAALLEHRTEGSVFNRARLLGLIKNKKKED